MPNIILLSFIGKERLKITVKLRGTQKLVLHFCGRVPGASNALYGRSSLLFSSDPADLFVIDFWSFCK